MQMSGIFRLPSTLTASFTEVKTWQMRGACCTSRTHTTHFKRQQGKFIALTATTGWQKQSLDLECHQEWPVLLYQKKKQTPPLFSTIPPALLKDSLWSLKGISRHFSKGNRKGQPWNFINTRHWGRKLQSQKEPSGLPGPCHLGSSSKCSIPLWLNATTSLKWQNHLI